ncbi:hypothetical protein V8E53_005877 [Lactarius tabidus]
MVFTWALPPPRPPKIPPFQSFRAYQACQAVPDTSMPQLDNPPNLLRGRSAATPTGYHRPWGLPPAGDPQNYGGIPPAIVVYPATLAAQIDVPAYPPAGAPFDAWNHIPPESPAAPPFDARKYVPPDAQQPSNTYSTYEPRTSESAFNTAMQLNGGGVISPVVLPASYLLPPLQSSSTGSLLYPQSPAGAMTRSISAHPTEREAAGCMIGQV